MRGDGARRVREVALAQRNDLRPARRAARVQEKRNGLRIRLRDRRRRRRKRQLARRTGRKVEGGDTELAADSARGRGGVTEEEHRAWPQILKVRVKLRRRVPGVEWSRRGSGTDDGEEGEDDFDSVGERQRHCVARADPCASELSGQSLDCLVEIGKADRVLRSDDRWMLICPVDQCE